MREKLFAWAVHGYTASGLIAAAGMAVCIFRGDAASFNWAIALMILATFIDSTDGWLARRARVKEVVPQFDGRRLDDIVDFQTYTSLPILFIWRAGILPEAWSLWLLVPLLASAYGFSQANAKTKENFFLGFPSYWNIVAIYLYWLSPPAWISLAVMLSLAVLTFVPSLYLYTSRGGPYSRLTNGSFLAWAILMVAIVAGAFADPKPYMWLSFSFPVYYFVLSWWITLRRWYGGSVARLAAETSPVEE